MTVAPADWYPDPAQADRQRYWNGAAWTQSTRPGVATPPPPPQVQATFQPQAQATFQPAPQATFQPQAQATFQPAPPASFQPQAQATFQPAPQATFQPQAQATFQPAPQATFQPQAAAVFQPQAAAVFQPQAAASPGEAAWSPGATWSPGARLTSGQGAAPATMPSISRDASGGGFPFTAQGFNPGTPARTFSERPRQRFGLPTRVGASLVTTALVLIVRFGVPALIDLVNGPDRILTAADVVAPAGWEVRASPSGAVAFAADPLWLDGLAQSSLPSYEETTGSEGLQRREAAGYWALSGTARSPATGLMVLVISASDVNVDERRTAETWMDEAAASFGDGNATVLASGAFKSSRGYDGWHTEYSVSSSSGTVYLEEYLIGDSDTAVAVTCFSTRPTSPWHDDLLALANSTIVVHAVSAPAQT